MALRAKKDRFPPVSGPGRGMLRGKTGREWKKDGLTTPEDMINNGLELTLNGDIIRTRDFVWSANMNITYNHEYVSSEIWWTFGGNQLLDQILL